MAKFYKSLGVRPVYCTLRIDPGSISMSIFDFSFFVKYFDGVILLIVSPFVTTDGRIVFVSFCFSFVLLHKYTMFIIVRSYGIS